MLHKLLIFLLSVQLGVIAVENDLVVCQLQGNEIHTGDIIDNPITYPGYRNCYSAELQFEGQHVTPVNISGTCGSNPNGTYNIYLPSGITSQWFNLTMYCPGTAGICRQMKVNQTPNQPDANAPIVISQICGTGSNASTMASLASTISSSAPLTSSMPLSGTDPGPASIAPTSDAPMMSVSGASVAPVSAAPASPSGASSSSAGSMSGSGQADSPLTGTLSPSGQPGPGAAASSPGNSESPSASSAGSESTGGCTCTN